MELSERARKARSEYMAKWRKENRNRISEYSKQYRKDNPDKIAKAQERYWLKKSLQKKGE